MPPRCGSTQRARRRSPGANWTKGEVVFSCSFCTHTRANTVRGGFARSPHRFMPRAAAGGVEARQNPLDRSEEHTSELQSLMRISYAVFCLKKKQNETAHITPTKP